LTISGVVIALLITVLMISGFFGILYSIMAISNIFLGDIINHNKRLRSANTWEQENEEQEGENII
jgi:hypothetical protein